MREGRVRTRASWIELSALLAATFAGSYYTNVTLVPLNVVLQHFRTGVGAGVLVLGGFAVSLAAATPLAAHIGERVGWTRALLFGVASIGIGAALAAVAPSFPVLVAVRVLQGAAMAVILPAVMILIATTFADRERHFALGMWSSVNSLARVVAIPAGGIIATIGGWSMVFWSAVPTSGIAIAAIAVFVPRHTGRKVDTDWRGAGMLTAGAALALGGLQTLGLRGPGITVGVAMTGGGLVLLWGSLRRARTVAHSFVPRMLLGSRTWLRSSAGGFAQMACIMVDVTAVSLYLVRVHGATTAAAGLVTLSFPAVMVVASPGASWLMVRIGGRRVFFSGLGLLTVAEVVMAITAQPRAASTGMLVGALVLAGVGAAFVQTSSAAGATRREAGADAAAVGLFNLVRFAGSGVGAAWLSLVLSSGGSYQVLFASWAAGVAATLLATALVGRVPGRAASDGGSGVAKLL